MQTSNSTSSTNSTTNSTAVNGTDDSIDPNAEFMIDGVFMINEDSNELTARITEVTNKGEVTVTFSEEIYQIRNYTGFDNPDWPVFTLSVYSVYY